MTRINAKSLINQLDSIFDIFGYATEIVTDNGPPFNAFEFKSYCNKHSLKQTFLQPYQPRSNCL